jgi:SUMO ligase MMS21 Smc5/6 complex component
VVDPLVCLENQLNYVPECLRSNLETKWTGMHGSQKEIDMLKYILRNACCLKTATILFKSTPDTEDKHKTMIQELLLSSTTCQLVFD